MSGPEIVDRQFHAHHPQWPHHLRHFCRVLDGHAFGDFEFQPVRMQAGPLQHVHHRIGQVALLELAGRDIDRHRHVETFAHPDTRRLAGRFEYLFADLVDQAGFLRQRNEGRRGNDLAIVASPARQGFRPDNLAGLEIDLWLEHGLELAVGNGFAQFVFQLVFAAGHARQARCEETEA